MSNSTLHPITPDWSKGYTDATNGKDEKPGQSSDYKDGYGIWRCTHPVQQAERETVKK